MNAAKPPPELPWVDAKSADDRHYKAALDNNHLGQWDLVNKNGSPARPVLVIEALRPYIPVRRRLVKGRDGRDVPEPIKRYEIRFVGKRKTWLAGPVSLAVLAEMFGDKRKGWIGRKVTLYVDPSVKIGRRTVGGIRVENVAPTGAPTEDPLDNEVDAAARATIEEAFSDEAQAAQEAP